MSAILTQPQDPRDKAILALRQVFETIVEKCKELENIQKGEFEDLDDFRVPYDVLSSAVQLLCGINGVNAWKDHKILHLFQKIASQKGPILLGHENWFKTALFNMMDMDADLKKRGVAGYVIQFTPWNTPKVEENGVISKSPERMLELFRSLKEEYPGLRFVLTIIKKMTKGDVQEEFSFARKVNVGFVNFFN